MTEASRDKEFLDASILDTSVPEQSQENLEAIVRPSADGGGTDVLQRSILFFGMNLNT